MNLLTTPYVFNEDEANRMARAGADIIVAHMGTTTGGSIGAKTAKSLESCAERIRAIVDVSKSAREDIIVLCHGGPIAEPHDAQYIMEHVEGVDGFYGASSVERLPAEVAIAEQIRRFRAVRLKSRTHVRV
jgi:predicted TIM-barrel enzyme